MSGKRCLAKAKTATARRTLDPLYQQQLVFHEKYSGCVLQVTTHRYLIEVDYSMGKCKFAKLKDKEYAINVTDGLTVVKT